jgi:hypothetical protein
MISIGCVLRIIPAEYITPKTCELPKSAISAFLRFHPNIPKQKPHLSMFEKQGICVHVMATSL